MACFHACLNELPSELPGFAFKGTDLIYIHCVSNENFAVTVGFTFVSLVCREVHISYVVNICKLRRSLIPAVVANLPVDKLFAGVGSPELIQIFFLVISRCKASHDSVIVSGLLTEKSDLRSCFCVSTMWHRRSQCEVCCETVSLFNISQDPVEDILFVSFFSVLTQMISQEID